MPNKPLYRALLIGALVLLAFGVWYYTRKSTWIKMIQKKWGRANPDATSTEVLVDSPLFALIGYYYGGQESWAPQDYVPQAQEQSVAAAADRTGADAKRTKAARG